MRAITLIITLLMATALFAQDTRVEELKQLSRNVNQIIQAEASSANEATLEEVRTLLESIKYVMRGEGPSFVTCSAMQRRNLARYNSAYTVIYEFAKDYDGLNHGRSDAEEFTQSWLAQYPCDFADSYSKEMLRLIDFAYNTNNLNMTKRDSRAFALKNINRVCVDVEYEKLYNRTFYHAYSIGGLNMSTREAHEYTRPIIFKEMFGCDFPAK